MNRPPITLRAVCSADEAELTALLAIYAEALPASERKSAAQLRAMLRRPEYRFAVAAQENEIAGFAICLELAGAEAVLLEYFAVRADLRGGGYGSGILRALTQRASAEEKFLLVEVEAATGAAKPDEAIRRMSFYRRHGCRLVAELAYRMPQVAASAPPPMQLMVWKRGLPGAIPRAQVRQWLESIYRSAYDQPAGDPRIHAMLAPLGEEVRLIENEIEPPAR